jgi:hypothetical protein
MTSGSTLKMNFANVGNMHEDSQLAFDHAISNFILAPPWEAFTAPFCGPQPQRASLLSPPVRLLARFCLTANGQTD